MNAEPLNTLFDDEIQGHHSMRDLVLSLLSDSDLAYAPPGNPSFGELLVESGQVQGVYTHSFEAFTMDWSHHQIAAPDPLTFPALRAWFTLQDEAMKSAMDRIPEDELRSDRIDRGEGFIASAFVQHEIYREAVYIFYGKISVYLRGLGLDAGPTWAAWVG